MCKGGLAKASYVHVECEKGSIVCPTAFNLSLASSIPRKTNEVVVRNSYLITIAHITMYLQRKSVELESY